MTAPPSRTARLRAGALYLGGLLGPFGGSIVAPMQFELRDAFDETATAVAGSLTVYFIPFALLLLVSGTLGERWGRRRTVTVAYIGYAAASLWCAAAPNLAAFLAGRAAQGAFNAFTTPLVLAGLADLAPPDRMGRSIGIFASFQAAGQSLGPFLGGAAAEVDWRLAFVGVAAVSAALTLAPPPGEPRRAAAAPPWRPLVGGRMALLAAAGLALGSGLVGLGFLVAERARDELGLSAAGAGGVLVGFGLAGLVLGQVWGRLTDRFDARRTGLAATLAGGALVATVGTVRSVPILVGLWVAAGACASLATVSLQRLTVDAVPANRGGAVSVMSSFRFMGSAVAPAVWLPLYGWSVTGAFAAAAATAGLCGAVLISVPGPRSGRAATPRRFRPG